MFIVRLEKGDKITYNEFDDFQKAQDFTTLGVSQGWTWDIYKLLSM